MTPVVTRNQYILAALTQLQAAQERMSDVINFLDTAGELPDSVKDADAIHANIAKLREEIEDVPPSPDEQDEAAEEEHETDQAANAAHSDPSSHGSKNRKPRRTPPRK